MAKKWYGWAGTILKVDLKSGQIVKEPLTEELAYKYGGGRGFNRKIIWEETKPGIDPLGPENVLCLGAGPFTGTIFPASARTNVDYVSPVNGIVGTGNAGGFWGAELKFAGYDQVVFYRRSPKPVYLWIDDDHVELRDARHIWGNNVYEMTRLIREDVGDRDVRVMGIGIAGENMVRITSTSTALYRAHGGAGGSGAVWGSKNLKAVAVRGTKGIEVSNLTAAAEVAQKVKEILIQGFNKVKECNDDGSYRKEPSGTSDWARMSSYGVFGTGISHPNYNSQPKPLPDNIPNIFIDHERIQLASVVRQEACFNCPSHCGHLHEIPSMVDHAAWRLSSFAGVRGGGPEGSSGGSMGGTGLYEDGLLAGIDLGDEYSMEHIGLGRVLSWALELYQRGIITKQDTDGIELEWGNQEAVIEMIHKIGRREGFGNLLAEGIAIAPKLLGRGSENYALIHKGVPSIFFQSAQSALSHMASMRGGQGWPSTGMGRYLNNAPETCKHFLGKEAGHSFLNNEPWGLAKGYAFGHDIHGVLDSAGHCMFAIGIQMQPYWLEYPAWWEALTGWKPTWDELLAIGRRITNLERAHLVSQGITRENDTVVPWRPDYDRDYNEDKVKAEAMMQVLADSLYEYWEWDQNGIPTRSALEKLGLKHVTDELEANLPYPKWDIIKATHVQDWYPDKYRK